MASYFELPSFTEFYASSGVDVDTMGHAVVTEFQRASSDWRENEFFFLKHLISFTLFLSHVDCLAKLVAEFHKKITVLLHTSSRLTAERLIKPPRCEWWRPT